MSLPQFRLLRARALGEALQLLPEYTAPPAQSSRGPDGRGRPSLHVPIRVVAGGTDLIPSMRQKLFEPEFVLDLRAIRPLHDGSLCFEGKGPERHALDPSRQAAPSAGGTD